MYVLHFISRGTDDWTIITVQNPYLVCNTVVTTGKQPEIVSKLMVITALSQFFNLCDFCLLWFIDMTTTGKRSKVVSCSSSSSVKDNSKHSHQYHIVIDSYQCNVLCTPSTQRFILPLAR